MSIVKRYTNQDSRRNKTFFVIIVVFLALGAFSVAMWGGDLRTQVTSSLPPSNLTLLAECNGFNSQIVLSWTNNPTGGPQGIYRCSGSTACVPTTLLTTVSATSTSYTNTGLTGGIHYGYVVFNSVGFSSIEGINSLSCGSLPLNLTATPVCSDSNPEVSLTWTNDPLAGPQQIRRCTGSFCFPPIAIATVSAETSLYHDFAVIGGITYQYQVSNAIGDSNYVSARACLVNDPPEILIHAPDVPTPPPPATGGTRNGLVASTDIFAVLGAFGKNSTLPDWSLYKPYDTNGDGSISSIDIFYVIGHFGTGCWPLSKPSSSCPAGSVLEINEGFALTVYIEGVDPDSSFLSHSLLVNASSTLPSNMNFQTLVSGSGTQMSRLRFTPSLSQSGMYSLAFSVTDNEYTDTETLVLKVRDIQ